LELVCLRNSAFYALGACLCWLVAIHAASRAKQRATPASETLLPLRGGWVWWAVTGLSIVGSIPLALLSLLWLILTGKGDW
jgi:hypothetical protein